LIGEEETANQVLCLPLAGNGDLYLHAVDDHDDLGKIVDHPRDERNIAQGFSTSRKMAQIVEVTHSERTRSCEYHTRLTWTRKQQGERAIW
jgi:hypothetical protein